MNGTALIAVNGESARDDQSIPPSLSVVPIVRRLKKLFSFSPYTDEVAVDSLMTLKMYVVVYGYLINVSEQEYLYTHTLNHVSVNLGI